MFTNNRDQCSFFNIFMFFPDFPVTSVLYSVKIVKKKKVPNGFLSAKC